MTSTTAPVPFAGIEPPVLDDEFAVARSAFYAPWLTDLMANFGEWRHPRSVAPQMFSADRAKLAGECCEMALRRGFRIQHGRDGYRLVGIEYVPLRVVGAPTLPLPATHPVTPGQLSLAEVV